MMDIWERIVKRILMSVNLVFVGITEFVWSVLNRLFIK